MIAPINDISQELYQRKLSFIFSSDYTPSPQILQKETYLQMPKR
jgi:hypothetical protein